MADKKENIIPVDNNNVSNVKSSTDTVYNQESLSSNIELREPKVVPNPIQEIKTNSAYLTVTNERDKEIEEAKKLLTIQKYEDNKDTNKEPLTLNIYDLIKRHAKYNKELAIFYYLEEIDFILSKMIDVFKPLSTLIEIKTPVIVCGDIHGQLNDLLLIFKRFGVPGDKTYLFLGDYIDRGNNSMEVINFLFLLKLHKPNNIHLLRGNHELQHINKVYGFYEEITERFTNIDVAEDIYTKYNEIFKYLPLAALVSNKILCMHGGISDKMQSLNDIKNIPRPLSTVDGIACDLLWADPDDEITGTLFNNARGVSIKFGEDFLDKFCEKFKLDMVIRGHQVCKIGFAVFKKGKLITVFSASDYDEEMRNLAGVVRIKSNYGVQPISLRCPKVEREKRRRLKEKEYEITKDVNDNSKL
ncbi:Serine/threonine-protein phosphatase PP1-beta catalytic subunit [Strongyloides ratti]|uniref:Serine/threonine-protein phosphatase n=1 Tax=Strongyloides ratti TaxID=34506 RepID=A0A090LGS6_STRRB|nr:Serine/threonine-protein phosphatase PP1-beta catalytic subunit [Strongyloides ratti]CEF67323.1 Serine/threonine-protein phosphatase PP1-beta catalytic subunit [Strongyloides ratti]